MHVITPGKLRLSSYTNTTSTGNKSKSWKGKPHLNTSLNKDVVSSVCNFWNKLFADEQPLANTADKNRKLSEAKELPGI